MEIVYYALCNGRKLQIRIYIYIKCSETKDTKGGE